MIKATPAPWPSGAMTTGISIPLLVVTINFSLAIVILPCFRGRENGRPSTHLAPRFDGGAWLFLATFPRTSYQSQVRRFWVGNLYLHRRLHGHHIKAHQLKPIAIHQRAIFGRHVEKTVVL